MLIPSKSDKTKQVIIDALRILSWQQYKAVNDVRGLDGYAQFQQEWLTHNIHKMTLPELQKLVQKLEYTEEELQKIRKEYYDRRNLDSVTLAHSTQELDF